MARDDGFEPLYHEIGQRIARARNAAGLSQEKLASRIRVTRTSVVNIEHGRQRAPIWLLWRISDTLGLEIGVFLPLKRELAERGAPVHLDGKIVAQIEAAAANDPATKRRLLEFIQKATEQIEGSDGLPDHASSATTTEARESSPSATRSHR